MSYLEELLPEFRKGAKIRQPNWAQGEYIYLDKNGIVYDERKKPFDFTNEELFVEWELYQEQEPDWDSIIKKAFGILSEFSQERKRKFKTDRKYYFTN